MSIDDRLEELTAPLVAGFLRLKRRTEDLPPPTPSFRVFSRATRAPAD
jgi:hypothetical protein